VAGSVPTYSGPDPTAGPAATDVTNGRNVL
jgi:hypothetical protein